MSQLIQAIKQAVGNIAEDTVKIFLGVVTDISLATTEGTVSVQQVSGKNISSIQEKDMNYSFNQQGYNSDTATNIINNYTGPLIFNSVQIQASPGDSYFTIPKLGSYVRVIYSKYQLPFIVQYQDIQETANIVTDDDGNWNGLLQLPGYITNKVLNVNNDGMQTILSMNDFGIGGYINNELHSTVGFFLGTASPNIGFSITNPDETQSTLFQQNTNSFDISVDNGAEITLDTTIDLKSFNGAEITLDTLITIKNQNADILNVLNFIGTALQDISAVTVPSGGGVIGTLSPGLVSTITQLQNEVSKLFTS